MNYHSIIGIGTHRNIAANKEYGNHKVLATLEEIALANGWLPFWLSEEELARKGGTPKAGEKPFSVWSDAQCVVGPQERMLFNVAQLEVIPPMIEKRMDKIFATHDVKAKSVIKALVTLSAENR